MGEQSRHRLHAEIFQLLLLHEDKVASSSQSTSLSRGACCHSVLRMLKEGIKTWEKESQQLAETKTQTLGPGTPEVQAAKGEGAFRDG